MSKLLDKLNQVSSGPAQALGFGAKTAVKGPRMVLIAALEEGSKAAAIKEADAVLLTDEESAKRLAPSLGDTPWGVSLSEGADGQPSRLKEMGCDFLVCDAEEAPLTLLLDEGMARIVSASPALPDGLIRATAQLPIDAMLIGGDPSLSVQRLMACRHMANLPNKPLIALTPLNMSADELRELWEAGVVGVVVTVAADSGERLSALRQAIDALPPSRRRKSGKREVLLPTIGAAEPDEVEEIVEEEE